MKLLFIYSEIEVETYNNKLYHNFLGDIIDRYLPFGQLTVCVASKEVTIPKQNELEASLNINYIFLNKENNFKHRFLDRSHNKQALEKAIKETDFIIIHVPCAVQDITAKYAKKYSKPYLAVVVGCPWDSLWNHSIKGKILAPLSYLYLKSFMKNVPYAIYVTQKFLQERYPTKGKSIGCSDVALPEQTDKIEYDRKKRISSLQQEYTYVLASIGALTPVKGHADVIKALHILKNKGIQSYKYKIIGGGNPQKLKELAIKHNVAELIEFKGIMSHDDIFNELEETDIYLQPSRTEGISRALVEAMNMGCPVIATNVGGNPELIGSEWLYKPRDIGSLVKKIISISDTDNMIKTSEENFYKAKSFHKSLLDKKRHDFIYNSILEATYTKI